MNQIKKGRPKFRAKSFLGMLMLVCWVFLPRQTLAVGPPQLHGPLPKLDTINSNYTPVYGVWSEFHASGNTLQWPEEVSEHIRNYANFPLKIVTINTYWYNYLIVGPLGSNPAMDACEQLALQQYALNVSNPNEKAGQFIIYSEKASNPASGYYVIWQNPKDAEAYPNYLTCGVKSNTSGS